LNGGTLGFNFINFTPVVGNSWDFLYADAIDGWNSLSFFFSGLGAGQTAQFSYANGVETLRIASVPEPSSFFYLGLALMGLMAWQWKQRGNALS